MDCLLRTNIYRTARWLALVSIFPSWPQFRLGNSDVIYQWYNSNTVLVVQFWYILGWATIWVAGIPGTVKEYLIVPTHYTCINGKNQLVYSKTAEWPGWRWGGVEQPELKMMSLLFWSWGGIMLKCSFFDSLFVCLYTGKTISCPVLASNFVHWSWSSTCSLWGIVIDVLRTVWWEQYIPLTNGICSLLFLQRKDFKP